MERIGENKLKPRRTRGTPSFNYINRLSLAAIALGTAIATAWAFIPAVRRENKRIGEKYSHHTEEEIDRRELFNFSLAPRTAKSIKESMEEGKRLDSQ